MTNSEHLIENVLYLIEHNEGNGYEAVMQSELIQQQAKAVGISMNDIWCIAQYVYYCYKPMIESRIAHQLIDRYGYEIDD